MQCPRISVLQRVAVLIGLAGFIPAAVAQSYAIDWWTVDSGGDFELSGTIGQPDAGVVLTGGNYELVGGFWPGAGGGGPTICRGDLNCDGFIDFGDINPFVGLLTNP